MIIVTRWMRLLLSYCLFAIFIFSAINYQTSVYLFYQAKGQLHILWNTKELSEFKQESNDSIKEKLDLIEEIKRYSIDSLGYRPTKNFTMVYDQKNAPALWVLTVSEPYTLRAYEWRFPLIGKVSYKGFFKKEFASSSYNHFKSEGYDADIRPVSAWSTLGWFRDPILSNTLKRSKGNICDLFFHELFHATYYAPGSVNLNENLASFIAHHATINFLKKDTISLQEYLRSYDDDILYRRFMLRQTNLLKNYYKEIKNDPTKSELKLKKILEIADSLRQLKGTDPKRFASRRKAMLSAKNAYFIDFEQYDSLQDSLEEVFNKIYEGNLKKMVQDLKQKAGNY
ncbi:MAG: aminopeptidase [Bacteroidia bacterium]